jgi:chromate transporter
MPPEPSFAAACRFWLKLGFISFGGPAGQIAIMHREVVETRAWVSDREFAHALNFCMLLPGPEALQLVIYLGWRLHGTVGGVVAGLCFILPAVVLLLALSFVYVSFGSVPAVAGALAGLQATVVALILQALVRLSRRALGVPAHWFLALAAFVSLGFLDLPFSLLLLLAGLAGALMIRVPAAPADRLVAARFPWRVAVVCLLLWVGPLAVLAVVGGDHPLLQRIYLFFTQAALVTFGGAYAVLAYVNQQTVEVFGWLTKAQAVTGLGLAESTPGPLIIVLQFVGFMAGWNDPGALARPVAATLAAVLASYATFLPSFAFILVGAPYVERLVAVPRLAGALSGITAAVAGVIAVLAVAFGRAVLLPHGVEAPAWGGMVIALAAFMLLWRTRIDPLWVIAGGMLAGLAGSGS